MAITASNSGPVIAAPAQIAIQGGRLPAQVGLLYRGTPLLTSFESTAHYADPLDVQIVRSVRIATGERVLVGSFGKSALVCVWDAGQKAACTQFVGAGLAYLGAGPGANEVVAATWTRLPDPISPTTSIEVRTLNWDGSSFKLALAGSALIAKDVPSFITVLPSKEAYWFAAFPAVSKAPGAKHEQVLYGLSLAGQALEERHVQLFGFGQEQPIVVAAAGQPDPPWLWEVLRTEQGQTNLSIVDVNKGSLLHSHELSSKKPEESQILLDSDGAGTVFVAHSGPQPGAAQYEIVRIRPDHFLDMSRAAVLPQGLLFLRAATHPNGTLRYWLGAGTMDNMLIGLADLWGNATCETSGPCWQKTYADCADPNPCTSDLCDAAHGGCFHEPLPDGVECAMGKACKAGVCVGGGK